MTSHVSRDAKPRSASAATDPPVEDADVADRRIELRGTRSDDFPSRETLDLIAVAP